MKLLTLLFAGSLLVFSNTSFSDYSNNPTPEINLNNPAGEQVKLSSLQGDIVLLDFWASWCGPCRKRHPELVGVYNQFKDVTFKDGAKFDIYSVSLDKNKANWVAAIEQDQLAWSNHVSDLLGWQSSAAKAYNIRSIPSNLLLNQNGEIIGKNLFGKELEAVLLKLQ